MLHSYGREYSMPQGLGPRLEAQLRQVLSAMRSFGSTSGIASKDLRRAAAKVVNDGGSAESRLKM